MSFRGGRYGVHRARLAWQNGYSESFNGRFRDEFLATEQFDTLLEAQVLAEDWRTEYNTIRPHGSLGGLTPAQFRAQWINQPALSSPLDHQTGPSQQDDAPWDPSLSRAMTDAGAKRYEEALLPELLADLARGYPEF